MQAGAMTRFDDAAAAAVAVAGAAIPSDIAVEPAAVPRENVYS